MPAPLKNLDIDRTAIVDAIKRFDSTLVVVGPTLKKKEAKHEIHRINISQHAKEGILDCFYLQTGKTSFSCIGQNSEWIQTIATFIADSCLRSTPSPMKTAAINDHIVLSGCTGAIWDGLVNRLRENCELEEKTIAHGKAFLVRAQPNRQQAATISFFEGRQKKFMLQGRDTQVFACITALLPEFFEDRKEIIKSQLSVYLVPDFSGDLVIEETEAKLYDAKKILGTAGIELVSLSVGLAKIDLDVRDYCFVPYPALRALEGAIKWIFEEANVLLESFDCFHKQGGKYYLTLEMSRRITNPLYKNCIEELYNCWNRYRHPLFHGSSNADSNVTIKTMKEAADIVLMIISLLNKTGKAIP